MIQLQIVIEYLTEPHTCDNCEGIDPASCINAPRPILRLQCNKLEREDANTHEREMAESIEELHAGIMQMIADQDGGEFKEIRKP